MDTLVFSDTSYHTFNHGLSRGKVGAIALVPELKCFLSMESQEQTDGCGISVMSFLMLQPSVNTADNIQDIHSIKLSCLHATVPHSVASG